MAIQSTTKEHETGIQLVVMLPFRTISKRKDAKKEFKKSLTGQERERDDGGEAE